MAKDHASFHFLSDLSEQYRVPGAVLGIRDLHRSVEVATGVADVRTDRPVTTDTRFLIGSISKAYTATIAMQLVDERRIELDAPVREYLPELRLADAHAANRITTRQLLSHTSGIEDPPDEAFAPAEKSLERFVATLRSAAQREAPGREFRYSNAGYTIVGRLVEVLMGSPFGAGHPEARHRSAGAPFDVLYGHGSRAAGSGCGGRTRGSRGRSSSGGCCLVRRPFPDRRDMHHDPGSHDVRQNASQWRR